MGISLAYVITADSLKCFPSSSSLLCFFLVTLVQTKWMHHWSLVFIDWPDICVCGGVEHFSVLRTQLLVTDIWWELKKQKNPVCQIQEKAEQRHREMEENKRFEAQLEADMKSHQPWGRGGGGAPLRDSTGNLIGLSYCVLSLQYVKDFRWDVLTSPPHPPADLNQMHKLNEEAYSNPEQRQRRATAAVATYRTEHLDPNERVSGSAVSIPLETGPLTTQHLLLCI